MDGLLIRTVCLQGTKHPSFFSLGKNNNLCQRTEGWEYIFFQLWLHPRAQISCGLGLPLLLSAQFCCVWFALRHFSHGASRFWQGPKEPHLPTCLLLANPLFLAGPRDSLLTNRIWQKDDMSLLRLHYKKTVFLLAYLILFSLACLLWWKPAAMLWAAQ